MFISSTASSALFPRHGAPAECAVSPRNEYSTDTRPVPSRSPHDTASSFETCANNATSTSLKKPSRTKCALVPTSSSAVPGQIRIVPGSFSRSMIFFTAIAAVMLTACPELCPSPCPGPPSISGAR